MSQRLHRPKWHLIYYILAVIDLMTIVGSLYLNHSVLSIYRNSVEVNQEWALHLADFLRLSDLAQQVNAPGNDVFDSLDADKELAARDLAQRDFDSHMAKILAGLRMVPSAMPHPELLTALSAVDTAMIEMTATADKIFIYFRNNDPERAAKFMASMDRSYANVTRQIGEAQRLVQEIQLHNSQTQVAEAGRLGRFKYLIGFIILVIVNLVIIYGHKIKKAMAAAEAKRQELIERLTISEAAAQSQLRGAIENMNEGFVLIDADDRVIICNERYRQFLGLSEDAVPTGRNLADVLRAGASKHHYTGAEGRIDEWVNEQLALCRNAGAASLQKLADSRWIQTCSRPTSDGGAVSICTDVSQLKLQELMLRENEQRLNQSILRLEDSRQDLQAMADRFSRIAAENQAQREIAEAASAAKSQFLANVSHELRTPLNAIIGFSEIMKLELIGPLGTSKYRQYANDIHESGSHLLLLINDLLDLAKIEACKYQLDEDTCSLNDIVEVGMRLTAERANRAGLIMACEIEPDLPLIHADERKLKQVLLNLLSNAIKFTPNGGTITVTVMQDHEGGSVLTVSDTGIGIPPHKLSQVLEPFVQVENAYTRRHAGTGLGLPLSKAFAELHGGSLTIVSEIGSGTSVSITLPAERTIRQENAKALHGVSVA